MARDTIYFVSDAHLGAPARDAAVWERQLCGFLRSIADNARKLYILGDLFDFWIEYGHAIRSDYFPVAHEIRTLVEKGVEVHYFAGNHDFAFGPFIKSTLGITVHPDSEEIELQGKHIHLFHGDGLLKFDAGYRLLRKVLRNSLYQALYKLLPPALGIGLASKVSGSSRKIREGFMNEKIAAEYRDHARALLDKGNDIVFFAHTHWPEHLRYGAKTYCNTGAWMRNCNFATLTDGQVRLWRWRENADPEEIPSIKISN